MAYQWNRDKAAANLRKHDIDFADAVSVFSDDLALTIPDERFAEERFVTIGLDGLGRVLWWSIPCEERQFGSSQHAKQAGKSGGNMKRDNYGS